MIHSPDRLVRLSRTLLEAAGVPQDEAEVVACHCVDANLDGHDSHGVVRIPEYVGRIETGGIVPGAPALIDGETATTARLDGGGHEGGSPICLSLSAVAHFIASLTTQM